MIARDIESLVASHAPARDVGPLLRISRPARPNKTLQPASRARRRYKSRKKFSRGSRLNVVPLYDQKRHSSKKSPRVPVATVGLRHRQISCTLERTADCAEEERPYAETQT